MHPIKRAANHASIGSQKALADLIGVTRSAVSQWLTTGVPIEHCPTIERLTQGTVRCEEMRPEVDWAYLRSTDCGVVKVGAGDTAPDTNREAA